MGKFKDLTGRQFGRLTALEPLPPHGKNTALSGRASASVVERR